MSRSQTRALLADAALTRQNRLATSNQLDISPSRNLYQDHDHGVFDRLGIRKGIQDILNQHGVGSLKILHRIATNILENIDDPDSKFRMLRRNAPAISAKIVKPSGVLQLVIDMGFRGRRQEDHDEWFIWLPKYTDRLRLYAELLSDAIQEVPFQRALRDEALQIARKREEDEDSVKKERQRFKSDREAVRDRNSREKVQREMRADAVTRAASTGTSTTVPQQTRRTKSASNVHTLDEFTQNFSEASLNSRE
ncbi:hypothetical protein VNI00_015042 [Paramarasmius palmivorus]|uniref:PUB domain-containing protein n=1 Tax=Paramarasmius palmivorus TaxID=297713 RepID=A0AAW0BNP6_9AGAR